MGGYAQKWVRPFRSYETLKSGASRKWFDGLSRLIEWFLLSDSNWIILGLTTSLLCIFDICCVSTAVVLVKNNVLLLVPIRKNFRTWFSQMFLIKAWKNCEKIVCYLYFNTRKNMGNDQKPRCSSCIAIESHNFKILAFLLYGYHIPRLKKYCYPCYCFLTPQFQTFTNR